MNKVVSFISRQLLGVMLNSHFGCFVTLYTYHVTQSHDLTTEEYSVERVVMMFCTRYYPDQIVRISFHSLLNSFPIGKET